MLITVERGERQRKKLYYYWGETKGEKKEQPI